MKEAVNSLAAAVIKCNTYIIEFTKYIDSVGNAPDPYLLDAVKDLRDRSIELERVLVGAMQPLLEDFAKTNPEAGILIAATMAYIKIATLSVSISSSAALRDIFELPDPAPKPIDLSKL